MTRVQCIRYSRRISLRYSCYCSCALHWWLEAECHPTTTTGSTEQLVAALLEESGVPLLYIVQTITLTITNMNNYNIYYTTLRGIAKINTNSQIHILPPNAQTQQHLSYYITYTFYICTHCRVYHTQTRSNEQQNCTHLYVLERQAGHLVHRGVPGQTPSRAEQRWQQLQQRLPHYCTTTSNISSRDCTLGISSSTTTIATTIIITISSLILAVPNK